MKPGEKNLLEAIKKHKAQTRHEDPKPYDNDWGWWIEHRLAAIETRQKQLLTLATTAIVAELARILFNALT